MKVLKFTLLSLAITLCYNKSYAYDFEVDGVYYNIDFSDMSLIVTNGEHAYTGEIVIPNEVSYNGRNLKVTKIDNEAFKNTDLLSIALPQDLLSIGRSAFEGCKSIKEIIFPTSLQWIEKSAFKGCSGLTSLTLPDNLFSINDSVFFGCIGLRSIVFPQQLKNIGNYSFGECLGLIDLEVSAETIDSAFVNCSNLRTVSLGPTVISINGTFQNCYNLETISFGTSTSGIYVKAFANCKKLTKIVIPNNILEIRSSAFEGCTKLKTVVFEDDIKSLYIMDSQYQKNTPLFKGCPLDSVYLGRPMVFFLPFENFKNYVPPFVGTPLRRIEAGKHFTFYCSDPNRNDDKTYVQLSYRVQMFENLDFLEYIDLSKVTYLKSISFKNCRSLKKAVLPDSLNINFRFYDDPFKNCISLTSVNLPNSFSEIEGRTFYGCQNLKNINLDNIIWIGKESFKDCISLDSIFLKDILTIGDSAFQNCYGLKRLEINRNSNFTNPTQIGVKAFAGCASLQSIKLCSSRQLTLSRFAFADCTSLEIIEAETPRLEMISSFENCRGLSTLILPNCNVVSTNAFHNCTNIKTLVFPDGITGTLDRNFEGCSSIKNVVSYSLQPSRCSIMNSFDNEKYLSATLYIPKGTKDLYLAEPYWKNFFNVVEFDPSSFDIEPLGILDLNYEVKESSRYSINGYKLPVPAKGINVIKMNDGTTKKVIVK